MATFGSPNSPGVTQGTAKDTLLAEYNNIEQVEELFLLGHQLLEPVEHCHESFTFVPSVSPGRQACKRELPGNPLDFP